MAPLRFDDMSGDYPRLRPSARLRGGRASEPLSRVSDVGTHPSAAAGDGGGGGVPPGGTDKWNGAERARDRARERSADARSATAGVIS